MQYSASRYQMWLLTLHCRSNNSDLARNHYVHLTEKSRKKVCLCTPGVLILYVCIFVIMECVSVCACVCVCVYAL